MRRLIILLFICKIYTSVVFAQLVPASRLPYNLTTLPWAGAGVVGGIPSRPTQVDCVNGMYSGQTLGTWDLTGATDMTSHIATCITATPVNQTAFLVAGTYFITSINMSSNVTLRGAGPNIPSPTNTPVTKLVIHGGANAGIQFSGNGQFDPPSNQGTWTSGYTAGTTQITIGVVKPIQGDWIALDVCDDNSTEVYNTVQAGEQTQFSRDSSGSTSQGPTYNRHLHHYTIAQTVTGNGPWTVTINPPLIRTFPSTGTPYDGTNGHCTGLVGETANPGAFWDAGSIHDAGVENLYIDNSVGSATYNIDMQYFYNIWVKNVESNMSSTGHVHAFQGKSWEVRDSYFHHAHSYGSGSYAIDMWNSSSGLAENNMLDWITAALLEDSSSGHVFGYNYVNRIYFANGQTNNFLPETFSLHGAHSNMTLYEGNITPKLYSDNIHGSGSYNTFLRNRSFGYQSQCPLATQTPPNIDGPCNNDTNAFVDEFHQRFVNIIGNVFGTAGYHNTYEKTWTTAVQCNSSTSIYVLGWDGLCTGGNTNGETNVHDTMLRTLNYDTVSNSVKNCSNDGGPGCQGGDQGGIAELPNSYYLSVKPAWYGNCVWPPIVPGVPPTVNTIPAQAAFNNTVCSGSSDTTAPIPGVGSLACVAGNSNPTITVSNIAPTSLTLTWIAACDTDNAQNTLLYEACRSLTNDVGTVNGCQNETSILSFQANVVTLNVIGLNPVTTYYFNVIVEDPATNKAIYTMVNATTGAVPAGRGNMHFRDGG